MNQRQSNHKLAAACFLLPAPSFTSSGQYARGSGYSQPPSTSRHENGPNVCSRQPAAGSGQLTAFQLQLRNVY
jgi:hypothetical protein